MGRLLCRILHGGEIQGLAVCLKRFIDWSHYRPENREIMLRTKTAVMREYPHTGKSFEGAYCSVNTDVSQALKSR